VITRLPGSLESSIVAVTERDAPLNVVAVALIVVALARAGATKTAKKRAVTAAPRDRIWKFNLNPEGSIFNSPQTIAKGSSASACALPAISQVVASAGKAHEICLDLGPSDDSIEADSPRVKRARIQAMASNAPWASNPSSLEFRTWWWCQLGPLARWAEDFECDRGASGVRVDRVADDLVIRARFIGHR
jgi:hypothetical protein